MKALSGFSSPVSTPPSFVIPVFSDPGDNAAYVQDLDARGAIRAFMIFDTDEFYPVSVMAPVEYRSECDEGIVAFWCSDRHVIVGSMAYMKEVLRSVDEADLPEFLAVEILSLVADEKRLEEAAARASNLLTSQTARESYKRRVFDRTECLTQLRAKPPVKIDDPTSLENVLQTLQTEIAPDVWWAMWSKAMSKFKANALLIDIARWRLINPTLERYEQQVIGLLIASYNPKGLETGYWWVQHREPTVTGYASIWLSLYRRKPSGDQTLIDLGLHFLMSTISKRTPLNFHSWALIWNRLWRDGQIEGRLAEIAKGATERFAPSHDSFAELVVLPLLSQEYQPRWALEYLREWLLRPKALRVWVTNYLHYKSVFDDEAYRRAGLNWIKYLGAGMNLWGDMWHELASSLPIDQKREIGESWLLRARKDLVSWVGLFIEVAQLDRGGPSQGLRHAASLWLEFHHGRRRNAIIEAVARGE